MNKFSSETPAMTRYDHPLPIRPAFAAALALAALSVAPAHAQSVEQFYTGKTISMKTRNGQV